MVSFQCEGCGDTLKKPSLKKHGCGQRGAYFACIDCSQSFPAQNNHTSCMSEAQKYEKSVYKGDKKKGAKGKQQQPPAEASKNGSATVDLKKSAEGSAVVDIAQLMSPPSKAAEVPPPAAAAAPNTKQPSQAKNKPSTGKKEASDRKAAAEPKAEPAQAKGPAPSSTAVDAKPAEPSAPVSTTDSAPAAKDKKERKKKRKSTEPVAEASTSEPPAPVSSAAPAEETGATSESKKDKKTKKRKSESVITDEADKAANTTTAGTSTDMQIDEPVAAPVKEKSPVKEKKDKKKRKATESAEPVAAESSQTATEAEPVSKAAEDKPSKSKKARKSVNGNSGPPAVSDIDPTLISAAAKDLKAVFSMNGLVKRGSDLAAHLKEEWSKSEDAQLRSAAVAEGVVQRALLHALKITQSNKGLSVVFET